MQIINRFANAIKSIIASHIAVRVFIVTKIPNGRYNFLEIWRGLHIAFRTIRHENDGISDL